MIFQKTISFKTRGKRDMNNLTSQISQIVEASEIEKGLVHIFNIGSTGAVGTIEFEPGLEKDLPEILTKLIPQSKAYKHEQTWHDGNGHSHLQATILGPELTVPVKNSKPVLGTWQQIFHLECDNKPHHRELMVTVMGE